MKPPNQKAASPMCCFNAHALPETSAMTLVASDLLWRLVQLMVKKGLFEASEMEAVLDACMEDHLSFMKELSAKAINEEQQTRDERMKKAGLAYLEKIKRKLSE